MVKSRAFFALLLVTTLTGASAAASANGQTVSRQAGEKAVVTDHVARFDGPMSTLRLVRDRLIMGFRISLGIVMVDLPIVGDDYQLHGIEDGPDGIDPLGAKDQGVRQNGPLPANSTTPVP